MKHFNLLKTLLLLCALIVGSLSSWADDQVSTMNFTAKCNGSGTANDNAKWTVTSDGTESNFDSTSGIHYGTNNAAVTYVQLTTSDISGTVKQVVVNARDAQATATISVTVGGSAYTCSGSTTATNSSANYTFTGSGSGAIVVRVDRGSSMKKAIYVKSVAVTYSSSGGTGGNTVDAPTFSLAAGAIAAGTKISLIQASADAIRYTTDGTTPTKTTGTVYSSPIEITTSTTIKAIAIKGDDVSSVTTAEYTISVNSPEFNILSEGNYLNGTEITLTSDGNTIYYTTDNSTPTSSSILYSAPISLDGKMTIKAIAYDSYGNSSSFVTRTMTGVTPASLPFCWAGGTKDDFTDLMGVIGYSLGSYSDNSSNRPYLVQMDKTGDYIEIFMDAKPIKLAIGVKMIGGGSTSKITVQESVNGVDFSDVEELTISGSQNSVVNLETSEDFSATTRVLKLLFTKGSNIGVGPISITSETSPVSISAAGFATFVSDFDLDYSSVPGLKAYKATVSGVTISFDKVTTVPAGEGVLLQGDEGTYDVPLTSGVTPWAADDNAFVRGTGAAVATGDGPYNYILNKVNGVVGFYKANGQTVAKNRAYLQSTTAAARISLNFDEETTGISEVAKSDVNNKVFDLQGRHIAQPTKGLYIMNGRKVLVK